jgi:hypothetical protein
MTRTTALKILNPILAVLALNQVATGLGREALSIDAFEVLHQGGGIVFAVAALLHVILNWYWVRANFLRKRAAAATHPQAE